MRVSLLNAFQIYRYSKSCKQTFAENMSVVFVFRFSNRVYLLQTITHIRNYINNKMNK